MEERACPIIDLPLYGFTGYLIHDVSLSIRFLIGLYLDATNTHTHIQDALISAHVVKADGWVYKCLLFPNSPLLVGCETHDLYA